MTDQENNYQYDPNHYDSGSGARKVIGGIGLASAAGGAYAWHKGTKIAEKTALAVKNKAARDARDMALKAKLPIPGANTQAVIHSVGKAPNSKLAGGAIEAGTKMASRYKLAGKIGAGVAVLGLGGAALHKANS